MSKPLPKHPNVRNCTHIKVTGQRCGSPALRGEFFCYFHTRVIKGVQQRVDMQLHSMALLEDCESIQLSIMHVVDGLIKGTLDPTRARLIIQALRIAARNAKNVRFDTKRESEKQSMVREVPDYAQQYLIEHPEFGPSLESTGKPIPCGADIPVRVPAGDRPCSPIRQSPPHQIERHVEILAQTFGLRLVALTRGANGSLLYQVDGDKRRWSGCPSRPAKVIDTVGAGDAFTAALVLGLLRRMDLDEINDVANEVARYVCSQPGATPQLPLEFVQRFSAS
jgi:sugar/nucleoside kinase (ribokinase family)